MTDTTDRVAFAAAELNAASDALASAAAEVDALRAEVTRQTGIAVDHCERADVAERMVVDLGAIIKEAADDLDCEDKRHAATGDTYNTTYVTETLKRGIAALSRTEAVAGRWVPVEQVINALTKAGLALGVHSADTIDAHIKRVREDFDAILTERDAAIAARDEAVREVMQWTSHFGSIDHAHDAYESRRRQAAAAERARDEAGIQLAAAQAEIARMRPVVLKAAEMRDLDSDMLPPRVRCLLGELRDASRALDAVPGDALAPRLPGVQNEMWRMANARIAELEGLLREAQNELRLCREKDGAGPYDPTLKVRITAALEASGIDTTNVKGVE